MIKPATDNELARYDAALQRYHSSELVCEGEFVAAIRERLRLAEVEVAALREALNWYTLSRKDLTDIDHFDGPELLITQLFNYGARARIALGQK